MKTPATKKEAKATLHKLRGFIGSAQLVAIKDGMAGEESQFFFDKIMELASLIETMPKLNEQGKPADQMMIYLHYFAGGQANFYIMEKDIICENDSPAQFQSQTFGLADLFGDGGELGYISIPEILACNGELDFHFTPCTLAELRKKP